MGSARGTGGQNGFGPRTVRTADGLPSGGMSRPRTSAAPTPSRRTHRIFTATRADQIPARCTRVLSLDGAVPGALRAYDHHQTGERINLYAMPPELDPFAYDGMATTLADTDALASVVAALSGGPSGLPPRARSVLEAASYRCDHLVALPGAEAQIEAEGRALDNYVGHALSRTPISRRSGKFAALCWEIFDSVRAGRPLPGLERSPWAEAVETVQRAGHIRLNGSILLVDLRNHRRIKVRPDAWYLSEPACRIAVLLDRHPRGGVRYTVGHNPFAAPGLDVRPALHALAVAEFAHGLPALRPEATVGAENWGGRKEVGGSPWNYGSRLAPDEVAEIVARAMSAT